MRGFFVSANSSSQSLTDSTSQNRDTYPATPARAARKEHEEVSGVTAA